MEFISCIRTVNEGADEDDEALGLCKVQIEDDSKLETLDESSFLKLRIKSMTVSEGTAIFSKSSFGINDLRIFTGEDINEKSKKYVWYELLKMLTGHKVYFASLDNKIIFTKWTCRMQDNQLWKVVMELESSGLIRRIAEFTLHAVTKGEIDLFEMAEKLYQGICYVNDSYRGIKESDSRNRSRVEELTQERELLDKLLEERDKKTRAMVVALLNEKKKRIRELHGILQRNNIKISKGDISDSALINMEIANPISELNSPGKRMNRRRIVEPQNLDRNLQDAKRRRVSSEMSHQSAVKEEEDDFDDFRFFGLSKRPVISTNNKLSENEDDTISLGNATGSISSLSDDSNDNRKHLVSLEDNKIRISADKMNEDYGGVSGSDSETETSAEEEKSPNNSEQASNEIQFSSQTGSETDIETYSGHG